MAMTGVVVPMRMVVVVMGVVVIVRLAFRFAPRRIVVPGFVEAPRPQQVLRPKRLQRGAPSDRLAGQQ